MSISQPMSRFLARTTPRRHRIRLRPHIYKYTAETDVQLADIVFDIINGCLMTDIDPQLYPSLLNLLKEREEQLKEWKNQPISKSIREAIEYISNYRFSEDPNQNPTLILERYNMNKGPTQDDIDYGVRMIIKGYDVECIDPNVRVPVSEELKRLKAEALQNGDYLTADKYKNAYRRILAISNKEKYEEITVSKAEKYNEKYQNSIIDLEKAKIECEERIKKALAEKEEQLRQLDAIKSAEIEEFDKVFETEVPIEMRKFSNNILQLRRREKYMVVAGRYIEAAQVHNEADNLEAIEREQQKNKYLELLNHKKKEFLQKLEENHRIKASNIERNYEKVVIECEKRIEKLEKTTRKLEVTYKDLKKTAIQAQRCMVKSSDTFEQNVNEQMSSAELFRQRARINSIVYTRQITTPRAKTIRNSIKLY